MRGKEHENTSIVSEHKRRQSGTEVRRDVRRGGQTDGRVRGAKGGVWTHLSGCAKECLQYLSCCFECHQDGGNGSDEVILEEE